jgi:hypothetical protein
MAMHCMRKFLTVKLTFVEVHDKTESKLFSLASCIWIKFISFQSGSNKLIEARVEEFIGKKAVNLISIHI